MKLATGIVIRPFNMYFRSSNQHSTASPTQQATTTSSRSLKTASKLWLHPPNTNSSPAQRHVTTTKPPKLRDRWMEFQGIKNWEGLLDPLNDCLRDEILRYGEFVEAAYRCFDFDTSSPTYATCIHPSDSMMSWCGVDDKGCTLTKNLHATCGVQLPEWTGPRIPSWVSTRSSWIGYVAVCTDEREIARLGRREVVIAYRGTGTCMEWLENLHVTLARLPVDMSSSHEDCGESMVQSGFLSLYTSKNDSGSSLQDLIRGEIDRILHEYADEPLSITVTGHSLGAALATLTAHDIKTTFKHSPLATVVSFGGPRIGNKSFRRQLEINCVKVLRIVNYDDPVTKIPGFVLDENNTKKPRNGGRVQKGLSAWLQKRMEDTQWVYAEIGQELRLSSRDCPNLSNGNVATCHDLKTYLHLVDGFVGSNCPLRATAKRVLSS